MKRERALEPAIYAASALAGLFCCSFMHFVTVPVDVVKTRMQVREKVRDKETKREREKEREKFSGEVIPK